MKKMEPISEKERIENEAAFVWLRHHGLTDREIKFFRWRYFDYDHKKLNINRTKQGRGNKTKEWTQRISYAGTPLEPIAERNGEKQKGKNIHVFYKVRTDSPNQLTIVAPMYYEYEINHICAQKAEENRNSVWTFWAKFDNMKVANSAD